STLSVSRMMLRDPQHNEWSLAHYLPLVNSIYGVLVSKLVRGQRPEKEKSKTAPFMNQRQRMRHPESSHPIVCWPPAALAGVGRELSLFFKRQIGVFVLLGLSPHEIA